MPVTIWVDADACPVAVREIICRAAERTNTMTIFVANTFLRLPPSKFTTFRQVPKGFDVADNEIALQAEPGDLVITQDIPLAAEIIEKGGIAVSPRGDTFSPDTIRERLNVRDFMDTMRASGVQSGGPPPLGPADRQAFANALDRYLAKTGSSR